MIFILGISTIPALCVSLLRFFYVGWKPVFTVHISIVVIFILFAVYRESLSYHIKVAIIIAVFFILGIFSALNLGITAYLIAFLMLSVFFGIIFWGKKPTLFIYFGGGAVILIIGFLTVTGRISPDINIENYTKFFFSWITTFVVFSLITALSIFVVGEIGYLLSNKIFELEKANNKLQIAHDEIKTLSGLLLICSHCKKIRDDSGYWNQIEDYISKHSEAKFSHGICQKCVKKYYPDFDI
ncbi:MAG: hypothetical protein GY710_03120 [Desulfobacteraceae bacterium]|nr:hypothetical protein [Desulfobacteraceae bacterium]